MLLNNFVDEVSSPFKYKPVNTLVNMLLPNDFMSIIIIKDIHYLDKNKQGLLWEFNGTLKYLVDNRLSMGLLSSFIFDNISNFI